MNTNGAVERRQQGGPPLALLAAISLVLLLAGLVIGVALAGVMPLPYGSATAIQDYVSGHHAAAVAIAVGTFGSSIPLAIYAATASARLRQLGVTAPGATIALAGGLLASAGLALSSLSRLLEGIIVSISGFEAGYMLRSVSPLDHLRIYHGWEDCIYI